MSEFDEYRPPQEPRRFRGKKGAKKRKRVGAGAQDGSKEQRMAEDFEFTSYYGKPVVKAPPWEWPIGGYLFLGGLAGGSALLATGAQATGNKELRRSTRLTAFSAASVGSVFLILDLGRPERLLNMFRVFKVTSPMSIGSWILGSFASAAALPAAVEADELVGGVLPAKVRGLLDKAAGPAGVVAGVFGGPLAGYTAVLLANTSNPTWNDAKKHLPYVFVSSASAAASGAAMVFTPVESAAPARVLGMTAAASDLVATRFMEDNMEPEPKRPLHEGIPGKLMKASEALIAAGGVGSAVAALTKSRAVAVVSGLALMAGSACTRFGVLNAGLEAVKDPSTTIGPQKRRAEARRRAEGLKRSTVTSG
ncbi:NrfD/PsrC family molybdoenzyme membrane anchor subunit [Corynebacterium minutissimum]|uniref:Polysulfide reductase NrfD n=1 Tax=Corynebacterium minutissimum TaxID=38301 RepID=A0A2X4RVE0_9CORY|nr:NrfD/PsrC family molybdoenzyme membrane anchor subunit [Corynebacterium minutissimum]KHO29670.1 nitrite reductase [Corynebacterium minutissimum]QPS58623.1 polysulfide reductase NrfD [Corynebacterium minutissimum]QQA80586.1 polysulfide reductase NrfD [Corynebacterium minutissimum]SQI00270.1 polysulfide reductase NrfD [Corynebacterium minutissimum]VEG05663.1 polysulfide reductase NrfD [Corynebacterium minutissimum]